MLVLHIKTDQPMAQTGLNSDGAELALQTWQGNRQLSVTIHKKIEEMLKSKNKDWPDIEGVLFFAGPGSFTGLRIGASVAGALASGLGVPVVSQKGSDWINLGIKRLESKEDEHLAIPFYGRAPRTTKPKK
jgi:tRNA threonylcarbamoyladenosine biosynthesis protein TsaB